MSSANKFRRYELAEQQLDAGECIYQLGAVFSSGEFEGMLDDGSLDCYSIWHSCQRYYCVYGLTSQCAREVEKTDDGWMRVASGEIIGHPPTPTSPRRRQMRLPGVDEIPKCKPERTAILTPDWCTNEDLAMRILAIKGPF